MSEPARTVLISNGTATSSLMQWHGGKGTFEVTGTFGGATITLQRQSSDDSTWVDIGASGILTAEGVAEFSLGECLLRAQIVGGTPSAIYASVTRGGH